MLQIFDIELDAEPKDVTSEWLSEKIGDTVKIHGSWINSKSYEGVNNEFPWHNELRTGENREPLEGTHSAIIWYNGEENCGGSLDVIKQDGSIENILFQVGKLIVFDIEFFHRVNHYSSVIPRVSLNMTISYGKVES